MAIIDDRKLRSIISESIKKVLREQSELDALAMGIASEVRGMNVYEGDNDCLQVSVNGTPFTLTFFTQCSKNVRKSWFKGDYYNPKDEDEYNVKIIYVEDLHVFTDDGEEIEPLKDNQAIRNAILKTCYVDPRDCDWEDYED